MPHCLSLVLYDDHVTRYEALGYWPYGWSQSAHQSDIIKRSLYCPLHSLHSLLHTIVNNKFLCKLSLSFCRVTSSVESKRDNGDLTWPVTAGLHQHEEQAACNISTANCYRLCPFKPLSIWATFAHGPGFFRCCLSRSSSSSDEELHITRRIPSSKKKLSVSKNHPEKEEDSELSEHGRHPGRDQRLQLHQLRGRRGDSRRKVVRVFTCGSQFSHFVHLNFHGGN